MSSCIFCPLLLLIIQLSFSFSLHEGNETDRLSLLAFKAQITDPLDALSSWNASTHFCKWSGVICGHRHQRIVELNLQSSQLTGNLSPHIGNLSFLRVLNLEGNYFSRDIPQELGRLFRLQRLVLGNNTFSGEIPVNISSCSNLLVLHLGSNNLTGKMLGNFRHPHARTGGVLIFAHRRVKHTDIIFNVVRQNRLHPRERVHII
jgi:hypothetical protein